MPFTKIASPWGGTKDYGPTISVVPARPSFAADVASNPLPARSEITISDNTSLLSALIRRQPAHTQSASMSTLSSS